MALVESIDTLDYDALVAEAQRRIIARSRGQWTLHAPVDPGITLIELFAWLLDERSYMAAQTGGDFAMAIMRLLGQRPRPARPAVTVLMSGDELVAGQELRFAHPSSQVTFTVDTALVPLGAIEPLVVRVDGEDVGADLRAKRPFELLRAGEQASRAELDITLDHAVTANRAVALAIVIDTDDMIEPQWSPDVVDAPPPAELRFGYRAAGGAWKAMTVDDGTRGLRRSGLLRFTLPADAEPIATPGRYAYTIEISAAKPTFTASPIVTMLSLDVTTASHRTVRAIGNVPAMLPLPGRIIELPSRPIEDSVELSIVEADQQAHAWHATSDFTTAKPGDRVFVVDRVFSCLRFGDGLNGRLPYTDGSNPITGSYLEGAGRQGNVGPGAWIGTTASGGVEATSIVPAIGGRDSETIADAQLRIANDLHVRTRAATADDYAVIATTTPGVAIQRAHAAIGFDPAEPCIPAPGVVTVFVLPAVPQRGRDNVRVAAPVTDPGALAAVAQRFATTRLLGTQVIVETARYRDVDVRVEILGDPWDPADTRSRAEAAIREHLDPLFGGSDHFGWPFGGPLRPSDLMRIAQAAVGGDGEVIVVGIATRGRDEVTCGDVTIASYELPRLLDVRIQLVTTERGA